ncbi:GNAT family N-acetyltransferase [Bacillus gobiensis]|uniref:GNAT family N-acetyltransferase n=1 Tax=Bacillus gobiensis TaxID=1441095 RepID=UPI003D24C45D
MFTETEINYYQYMNQQLPSEPPVYRYRNPLVPLMYDHNFIYFERMPEVSFFQDVHADEKNRNLKDGMGHTRYYFPVGEEAGQQFKNFLSENEFTQDRMLYYKVDQEAVSKWLSRGDNTTLEVTNERLLDKYLSINKAYDLQISERFADQKQILNKAIYQLPKIKQYLAFCGGKPAGSGELFIDDENRIAKAENLFISESFQNRGVARQLLKTMFIDNKEEISSMYAVTYEEDTAKHFYEKLGFTFVYSQHTALQIIKK